MFHRLFRSDHHDTDDVKAQAELTIEYLRQQRYYALQEARKTRLRRRLIEATGNPLADAVADRKPVVHP